MYPPGPSPIRPPHMQQMPSNRPPMMMHNTIPPALPLLNNNYPGKPVNKEQNMYMPDPKRQRTDSIVPPPVSSIPPPPMGNNLPPPPPPASVIFFFLFFI